MAPFFKFLLRFWQQFHSRFTEGYRIIKYRSRTNLEVIRKLLTELWSFLVHLRRRLMDELNSIPLTPAPVRLSTFSIIFSSETTGPIKLKFHMETPYDAGTKACSNSPGHMTKMASTPIYGKKPLKIFSRTRGPKSLFSLDMLNLMRQLL